MDLEYRIQRYNPTWAEFAERYAPPWAAPLALGNAGWPAAYASELPAGAYQLTWGTRGYGSVTVDFTIVEMDGWLYLGEESIQSTATMVPDDERE